MSANIYAGSTGVSLAMVAAAKGCRCHIAMPDDAALEKSQLLSALGAQVQRVRPVSITHPGHFVNVAKRVGGTPLAFHLECCYTMGRASQVTYPVKLSTAKHIFGQRICSGSLHLGIVRVLGSTVLHKTSQVSMDLHTTTKWHEFGVHTGSRFGARHVGLCGPV